MSEDKNLPPKPSRRDFLKMAGAAAAFAIFGSETSKVNAPERTVKDLVSEVEALSLQELEQQMYEVYPIVPNIESIRDRLNGIAEISEKSTLMKLGTSTGLGMLSSIYGPEVDVLKIDLDDEKYKADSVLAHFEMSEEALMAGVVVGVDVNALLHDPMICRDGMWMACAPGVSVVDAYIDNFQPKVAINFTGTNMIRARTSLSEFADSHEDLIKHYIERGVIPILTTFPEPPNATEERYKTYFNKPTPFALHGRDEAEWRQEEIEARSLFLPENVLKYNVILLKIAELYKIPIINLQRGVVENSQDDGTKIAGTGGDPDIDPLHFSQAYAGEATPLKIPNEGEKFQYGEQAVSYYVIQTLYEMVK